MHPRRLALLAWTAALVVSCVDAPVQRRQPVVQAPLMGPARQLTFAGLRSGEGYFSRDGRQLVFQSEREPGNPFFQIYWMDLASGRVERASPGVGKTTCGWIHPSGARLLFSSTHLDPASKALQAEELARRESGKQRRYEWDYDPSYDIFSVALPLSDAAPVRLTSARGYDAEASWSPDGRHIVFASNRHHYARDGGSGDAGNDEPDLQRFIDIYIMDSRGGSVRRLTDSIGYDGGPFFSPDGKRIVWRRFNEEGTRAEIYSMRTDGSDVRQITRLDALSWAPFYHPSGDYLIFATNLQGFENFELYMVATSGESKPVRVTEREGFDGLPVFSPDGDELVFTRKPPGGRSQLYRATWDDARARRLLKLGPATVLGAGPLLEVPKRLSADIEPRELRGFVEALASPDTNGRLTGTGGEKIATSYVARVFRSLGLEPAGDAGGYFQEFGFTAGVSLGGGNRLSEGARELTLDTDWRPLSFSGVGDFAAADVVFAGYGLVAPDEAGRGERDAYAHLDVTDRWVMVLRYLPEGLDPEERRNLSRYSSLRYKAMVARDRGARGILFVSGPRSKVREQLVPLRFDATQAGTRIAVASLSDAAADQLIRRGSSHNLADLQAALDREIAMPGFRLDGVAIGGRLDIQQQRKKGRNVLARLPARAPKGSASDAPVVLLGAHVDHLGTGAVAGSLAREDERGEVHRGADDNASGVAALLEIAAFLASEQAAERLEPVRDVVFAAWSGEELGLLGSAAYADAIRKGAEDEDLSSRIAAYLNMDMVGRMRSEVSLLGVDSSPAWRQLIESRNIAVDLPVEVIGDSYLPTDATTFYLGKVPILSAFTGSHDEYHTPRDVPELLDYAALAKVAQLMGDIAGDLSARKDAPSYAAADNPARGIPRAGLRVYLGTIPDYTNSSDIVGLRLSGVAAGGPAEKAGLRAGDVIVEVNGHAVENIYDYTFSLDSLSVGEPAEFVVRRGSSRTSVLLTPVSRD